MTLKRLLLGAGTVIASAGLGLGIAGAVEGDPKPTTFTPVPQEQAKAQAAKCEGVPVGSTKECSDPVVQFADQTGFVPVLDRSGRIAGYIRASSLRDPDATVRPVYSDATGRVLVGGISADGSYLAGAK